MVIIQHEDFDVATLYHQLASSPSVGGVVSFVGKVRDFNQGRDVTGLLLEHYPGMTEKALNEIICEAKQRWPIEQAIVVHRVGQLALNDQIVFVGVSSPHRKAAFAASEFIIDYLKTRAPFWKKETTQQGEDVWVEAEEKDKHAEAKWKNAN
ncbi:molybdopterin synthase catalytic subunit MoaE [Thaumasiovibrio sp. DFM-14]|uniref:molybdopterin synthase catalytic subunit MoaE n=1 Tax=Thaumasiovibrio sp. DFM-14 TaxID=3384792 RepID=UPI0039A2E388